MTKIALGIWAWFATMIATATMAQGVVDVHSHIITPEFVSSLGKEGRLMDEGFPLPKYNVESHLKWMDEARCTDISPDISGSAADIRSNGQTCQRDYCSHQTGTPRQIPVLRCYPPARCQRCHPRSHLCTRHAESRRYQTGHERRWSIPWCARTRYAFLYLE